MSMPKVGARIQIGKDRATVMYTGTVEGTTGEWLGIEWDDPTRGKHDGLHQGTRYFSCRHAKSGSFVRYHAQKVVTGTTFMKALKERYTTEDDFTTVKGEKYEKDKDIGELYFGGNKQIVVETYGFEKILRAQRGLSGLTVVGLAEQCVAWAGPPGEISEAELAIEDLDLSRDLIADWKTVSEITSQLGSLMILRINQSRLSAPPREGLCLGNLRTLSLIQTGTTWKEIDALAEQLPLLQDLQLGSNGISELGTMRGLQNLVSLNLEENHIADWSQVATLGALPKLEVLFLNDNELKSVEYIRDTFKQLRFLRLENNQISNMSSLDALDGYPSLTKLRCKANPMFSGLTPELETTQIVGRIGRLTTVNGNTVTRRERVDLERFYLKSCTVDGVTHEAIGVLHPRYATLCQRRPTERAKEPIDDGSIDTTHRDGHGSGITSQALERSTTYKGKYQ
ncbi:CAP Gly-rich domain-containing protein [Mucor mucedo]|uniref:CAP Gly-rich domain-containing protein n=1 Tax=Mucor mucedo TaxID=29922 RepID=UPI00221E7AAB|nr:CAP Gly-rich domain-containing protein [Mucor mucedo]KAI7888706.1 CAP Gly-rich domain-containing protein [Mucor mucedo]